MNAPISLVLPTPVANANVNEVNALSNSVNIGYFELITFKLLILSWLYSFIKFVLFNISSNICNDFSCGFLNDIIPDI